VTSPLLLATLTLLAAFSDPMNDGVARPANTPDPTRATHSTGASMPEPGVALVRPGDPAPDFWYSAVDGHSGHLRDLLAQGPVLLVFGGGEPALVSLQRERDALIGLGVVPVAMADLRPGAVRSVSKRLALTFPVLPDPRAITASQFNSLDPATTHPLPAWFVIDRGGRVRALARGSHASGHWAQVASDALALPAPGTPRPVSTPR
jgi:peroxiredoxin